MYSRHVIIRLFKKVSKQSMLSQVLFPLLAPGLSTKPTHWQSYMLYGADSKAVLDFLSDHAEKKALRNLMTAFQEVEGGRRKGGGAGGKGGQHGKAGGGQARQVRRSCLEGQLGCSFEVVCHHVDANYICEIEFFVVFPRTCFTCMLEAPTEEKTTLNTQVPIDTCTLALSSFWA